jgi:hypothetical protein
MFNGFLNALRLRCSPDLSKIFLTFRIEWCLLKARKKMKATFTSTKQSLQQAGGPMSIRHRCGSPIGNLGLKL